MFTNVDVKFLLIFKFAHHQTKEPFVSAANKALVGILITIGDVIMLISSLYVATKYWTKNRSLRDNPRNIYMNSEVTLFRDTVC